jgi:hypothetical protein
VSDRTPGAGGGAGAAGGAGSADTSTGSSGALFHLDGGNFGDSSTSGTLVIEPTNPTIDVTVVDGVVTQISALDGGSGMITFHATGDRGMVVTPAWSIDRGELGSIDVGSGVFTTPGTFSGVAKVTATYGSVVATTNVTIRLHITQNGKSSVDGGDQTGAGGVGGVGGEGLGAPVDDATRTRLKAGGTPPASAQEFSWLYPYDKTVWPRGLFAPLLQWKTSHTASAVYIHITQANFEFQGFYSGAALVHQPIDQAAWKAATVGNGGDSLHVDISIADATNVYGPISEDWIVAPGVLKGTVYYNSYDTKLAMPTQNGRAGATLAIKPGQTNPVLAIPGSGDKCIVCHTVSDDGSTLFAQNPTAQNWFDYPDGTSFNLTNNGAVIANYTGSAPDGTTNNRKFLWSGLSKDGTYGLQSTGGRWAYTQEGFDADPRVFRRDNGNAVTATGFDGQIKQAVTPSFSRDGKTVVFGYAEGTAPNPGHGHSLDLLDFTCGAAAAPAAGAPSCGTFAFSNLRRLYTNADNDNGYVGWPSWLPDNSGVVFHNVINKPNPGAPLATWNGSKTQIWFVDVPADKATTPQGIPMRALNGIDAAGNSILPQIAGHEDDYKMNYEPTVTPISSGGYFWVVFTSRRAYGNIATGNPYDGSDGVKIIPKKLWVAAIDQKPTPGKDPSHPAFYLPGQELTAGNMRGYWVVDPCHPDGASCETGDECCNGYCRPDGASGKLVCGGKPNGCAQEYEKCAMTSDCCGATLGFACINGFCASPQVVK